MNHEDEQPTPRKLSVFCGERFLLTVHDGPLRATRILREKIERHPQRVLRKGVDVLLYTLVDQIVDIYVDVAEDYEKTLEALEDRSFEISSEETFLEETADLRKKIVELRRIAVAQRSLFNPIAKGNFEFVSPKLEQSFQHIVGHLTHTIELIDGMREMLGGVVANYHSNVAKETNDMVKTLTIYAAILLPLSLIAGIYGMNVPIWPNPNKPVTFWYVITVMMLIAGGSAVYFRKKKWL